MHLKRFPTNIHNGYNSKSEKQRFKNPQGGQK